jgi:hypothetical protein
MLFLIPLPASDFCCADGLVMQIDPHNGTARGCRDSQRRPPEPQATSRVRLAGSEFQPSQKLILFSSSEPTVLTNVLANASRRISP